MGYAIFIVIAFVMLGVERLVHFSRADHAPNGESSGS